MPNHTSPLSRAKKLFRSPGKILKNRLSSFAMSVAYWRTFLAALVFLRKHPEIYKNTEILVAWHCSFGHPILGLDANARLYHPNRISVINIHHPRNNPYLLACFHQSMDVFEFDGPIKPYNGTEDEVRYLAVRAAVMITTAFKRNRNVLSFWQVHNALGKSDGNLKKISEQGLKPYHDVMGLDRMWQLGIGVAPQLPETLKKDVVEAITRRFPDFFDRPFAVVLLREKKRTPGMQPDADLVARDELRDSGPQETYRSGIRHLTENGYHVVGLGETKNELFQDIEGYYSLDTVDVSWQLINIFALTNCALLISGHSGPLFLSESVGAKVILCNAYPLTTGSHAETTEIVFKRIYDKKEKRLLSFKETYSGEKPPAFWAELNLDRYEILDNSEQDILAGVEQGISSLNGTLHLSKEDRDLQEAFRSLPRKDMPLYYQKNCPPLKLLRAEADSLLDRSTKPSQKARA